MNTTAPEIKKSAKRQFPLITRTLRKYSVVVAYYLNKLHITPHQVLYFRVIVFAGLSLLCFYSNDYRYNILGLFLIALCYFFDLVDGDLARNHNQVTKLGGFLDGNFDAIVVNSIILTFTLKFFENGVDQVFIIAGIMALYGTIFSSKMTELFQNQFSVGCGRGSDVIEDYLQHHKLDWRSTFIYQLITPKGFPFTLLSNFRDYLLVGVLSGHMEYGILGFAIAINIRWISLFIAASFYYQSVDTKGSDIQIYNLLKQSEK